MILGLRFMITQCSVEIICSTNCNCPQKTLKKIVDTKGNYNLNFKPLLIYEFFICMAEIIPLYI